MVKLKKGNLLAFGISEKNVELLKKDQPIKFNLQELGMGDIDVMIFYGKDEDTLYQMVKPGIHPMQTIIKDDNAPKN